jgi:hypothetical protein
MNNCLPWDNAADAEGMKTAPAPGVRSFGA